MNDEVAKAVAEIAATLRSRLSRPMGEPTAEELDRACDRVQAEFEELGVEVVGRRGHTLVVSAESLAAAYRRAAGMTQ